MRFLAVTTCFMIALAAPALAQTPPGDAAPAKDSAAPAPAAAPAGGSKREACKAAASKLRGMERADSMQVCMAEARLACVKEAVAQKMPVPKRKDFFKTCVGGGGAD